MRRMKHMSKDYQNLNSEDDIEYLEWLEMEEMGKAEKETIADVLASTR